MIALAFLLAAGFEPAGEHRIEILTPETVIMAEACDPEYLLARSGGAFDGHCGGVRVTPRTRPGGVASGEYTVRLRSGLVFQGCSLIEARRTRVEKGAPTVIQFECKPE